MKTNLKTIVYIDGTNLYMGVQNLGWQLDYQRFRIWFIDKYRADIAYIFLGLILANKELYTKLQECGYVLVYKGVIYDGDGRVKGNCDVELVLKAARDFYENRLEKAVLVVSDGDYACLVSFLKEKGIFQSLISPSNKCSFLLRKLNMPIVYLDMIKTKVMKRF